MIEKELFTMFKSAFVRNCELDGAEITGEELSTLEELDTEEVLINTRDLLNDLLSYKEKVQKSEETDLLERSEQFETMIQKLEGEVRTHIGVEHQLKLHIDTVQSKLEELETLYAKAQSTISELNVQNSKEEYEKKIEHFKNLAEKYKGQYLKLKKQATDKPTDNDLVRKSFSRIENLKKKTEDKSDELNKVQVLPLKNNLFRANKRRKNSEAYRASPFIIKENKPNSKGIKSSSKHHFRSISDNKGNYARRAPSR